MVRGEWRHARRASFGLETAWGFFTLLLAATTTPAVAARGSAAVPRLDHVVVIVMENRSYDEARRSPYLASLVASGSSFSNCHAVTHPSQPNYLALWSGSTQGVTSDACPASGSPFGAPNLGAACEAAGLTWRTYSEDLPEPGWAGCWGSDKLYARKHEPWTDFSNVDHSNERPFSELERDEASGALPNLAFVIPNMCDDMHNPGCPLSRGDAWLSRYVPGILRAVGPRGLVVVTWDEDDNRSHNRILTIFKGPRVRSGRVSNDFVDHYGILRTICDALGLVPFGAAAQVRPITGVWLPESISKKNHRHTTAAAMAPPPE